MVCGPFIDKSRHRLQQYFWIELAISVFGALSIGVLNLIAEHTSGASYSLTFLYIFVFLSIPTFLMGATVPVLCKILYDLQPKLLQSMAKLYFVNTLGASFGALFTAYVLISFFGIDTAIYTAATINLVLAIWIYAICVKQKVKEREVVSDIRDEPIEQVSTGLTFALVFITGFLAIGYEIVWFRFFSILTKSSPYSFASTLSVHLIGIALGSYLVNSMISKKPQIRRTSLFL